MGAGTRYALLALCLARGWAQLNVDLDVPSIGVELGDGVLAAAEGTPSSPPPPPATVDAYYTLALTGMATQRSLECVAAATLAQLLAQSQAAGELAAPPTRMVVKEVSEPVGELCAQEQKTFSTLFQGLATGAWIGCYARRVIIAALDSAGTPYSHLYRYPPEGFEGEGNFESFKIYFTIRAGAAVDVLAALDGLLDSNIEIANSCPGFAEDASLGPSVEREQVGCTDSSSYSYDPNATYALTGSCWNYGTIPPPLPPPSVNSSETCSATVLLKLEFAQGPLNYTSNYTQAAVQAALQVPESCQAPTGYSLAPTAGVVEVAHIRIPSHTCPLLSVSDILPFLSVSNTLPSPIR
jgi:hypothetical protein